MSSRASGSPQSQEDDLVEQEEVEAQVGGEWEDSEGEDDEAPLPEGVSCVGGATAQEPCVPRGARAVRTQARRSLGRPFSFVPA
jgi:hypothetical protein